VGQGESLVVVVGLVLVVVARTKNGRQQVPRFARNDRREGNGNGKGNGKSNGNGNGNGNGKNEQLQRPIRWSFASLRMTAKNKQQATTTANTGVRSLRSG